MFCGLFSSQEYAQFWVFGGTCVSLVTSQCSSVSFCIVLCVVSALNSQAIQNKACTFTIKISFTYAVIVWAMTQQELSMICG